MSIKSLLIENLFGRVDYNINFENSDIFILTGPNGYGKTMIFKIIDNIFKNNFQSFFSIKFNRILLEIQGGGIVDIYKDKDTIVVDLENKEKNFSYSEGLVKVRNKESSNDNYYFVNIENKKIRLQVDNNEDHCGIDKDMFGSFFGDCKTTFIKTQRLYESNSKITKIEELSKDLTEKINIAFKNSTVISQRLDSSFPFRLFEKIENGVLGGRATQAKDRLIGLRTIKKNYINYGLIEPEDEISTNDFLYGDMSRQYSDVLDLYVEDALEKISPYKEIYEKIDIFVSLLNEKMLAFKEVKVSKEKGFYFIDDKYKEDIPLEHLSSGEQNQIVIYYDLIFNSDKNSIILIDEPEISLHVAWQKEFLSSVERIVKVSDPSKILIATHSPQIIDNRWDMTIDLYDLNQRMVGK